MFATGTHISSVVSGDVSGTGQVKDRPNVVPGTNPYVGGETLFANTSSGRTYRYLGANSVGTSSTGKYFTNPSAGTYGAMQRDSYYGPSFRTVDLSLFKHTPITEKVMSELPVEIFNAFNINNFANPNVSISSGSFGIISNTRNAAGAPGLGYGEPFNIQFAIKVSF